MKVLRYSPCRGRFSRYKPSIPHSRLQVQQTTPPLSPGLGKSDPQSEQNPEPEVNEEAFSEELLEEPRDVTHLSILVNSKVILFTFFSSGRASWYETYTRTRIEDNRNQKITIPNT